MVVCIASSSCDVFENKEALVSLRPLAPPCIAKKANTEVGEHDWLSNKVLACSYAKERGLRSTAKTG